MFMRKKTTGTATEKVLQQSRSFEVTLYDAAKKSERKAWWVAFSATAMSVLLAMGYVFIMPLKEQVPYLVLADPYRGTSTVARIDSLDPSYTSHEFFNKSNVGHFVIARESYDWDVSSRRDRRLVYSMATGPALAEYKHLYNPDNPESPDKTLGPNVSLRIKILGMVLSGQDGNKPPSTASVRFERWQFNRVTGESQFIDTRIATLKIGYDKNLQMNEEGRLENPLGFRVYAYRVDPDSFGAATNVPPAREAPGALPVVSASPTVVAAASATQTAASTPAASISPTPPMPVLPAADPTAAAETTPSPEVAP